MLSYFGIDILYVTQQAAISLPYARYSKGDNSHENRNKNNESYREQL